MSSNCDDVLDEEGSNPVIDDVAAYQRVFKPKRAIERSPTRPATSAATATSQQPQKKSEAPVLQPKKLLHPSSVEDDEDYDSVPFSPPPAPPPLAPTSTAVSSMGKPVQRGSKTSEQFCVCAGFTTRSHYKLSSVARRLGRQFGREKISRPWRDPVACVVLAVQARKTLGQTF